MSPLTRVLVTVFLGFFGVHKFIDGKIGMGLLYLFTCGLFGIGWLIDIFKATEALCKAQSACSAPVNFGRPQTPEFQNPEIYSTEDFRFSVFAPTFIDGATLQYRYEFDILPVNEDAAGVLWALTGCGRFSQHELMPSVKEGLVEFLHLGDEVATSNFKVDMFSDWEKNGDPIKVFLKEANKDAGVFRATAYFYRDRRPANSYREQTVVALLAYKGKDKQETISILNRGEELELASQKEAGHAYLVRHRGEVIGRLPAKESQRVEDDPPTLIVFENANVIETSSGNEIEQPFVRIYW